MSCIREKGDSWLLRRPAKPDCKNVDLGGPDCVRPHMLVAARAAAKRQDRERAEQVYVV